MSQEQRSTTFDFEADSRAVESVHSAMLLFGYSVVLAFFMAAVIFINGA